MRHLPRGLGKSLFFISGTFRSEFLDVALDLRSAWSEDLKSSLRLIFFRNFRHLYELIDLFSS